VFSGVTIIHIPFHGFLGALLTHIPF
jgi:hypothetical protein